MARRKTHDPNRNARIYRVETWDGSAMFAVVSSTDDLTAREASLVTAPLRGTKTHYRVIVDYGKPYGMELASTVCQSAFDPHQGWIDAPVDREQFAVYRERVSR